MSHHFCQIGRKKKLCRPERQSFSFAFSLPCFVCKRKEGNLNKTGKFLVFSALIAIRFSATDNIDR
jgi:hypothetical protein